MRLIFVILIGLSSALSAKNFSEFPRTEAVVNILVEEHGLDRDLVEDWMSDGVYRQAPVSNLSAPAESTKSYVEYRPMFLSSSTIRQGKSFLEKYQALLQKAEDQFGVPKEVIVAIIGIESRYGRSLGRHKTFDSLGSLAVTEGRRADYFQREWIKFIVIMHGRNVNPLKVKGSYAGATGYPQFMPSSYEAYAVDHDGDQDIDIWNDPNDAIGSVANYLKQNGWKAGQKIISDVLEADDTAIKINSFARDRTLNDVQSAGWNIVDPMQTEGYVFPIRLDTEDGKKYWLGYRNFWVVSRYNRSISYSMAVVQLAEAIQE